MVTQSYRAVIDHVYLFIEFAKLILLYQRIEKQRQKIFELTDELEQAKEAFEKLQEELKEQQKKELLEAFDKSNRSFEEVLDFMKGKADI